LRRLGVAKQAKIATARGLVEYHLRLEAGAVGEGWRRIGGYYGEPEQRCSQANQTTLAHFNLLCC
jgi:hypothetical protein